MLLPSLPHPLRMWQYVPEFIPTAAALKALGLGAGAVTLSAAGLVPRVGPVRAVVLGLTSKAFPMGDPRVSVRDIEAGDLRKMLSKCPRDEYVVVVGGKGVGESVVWLGVFARRARKDRSPVTLASLSSRPSPSLPHRPPGKGKTCLVDTVVRKKFGVVRVDVMSGTPVVAIVADALLAITRSNLRFLDHKTSARRVLAWHQRIFRTRATVVLHALERSAGKPAAEIGAAARVLCRLGALVLVDTSYNALETAALHTIRQNVVYVDLMPREMLEAIDELGEFIGALKAAQLDDILWAVAGGNPAHYFHTCGLWEKAGQGIGDIEAVVLKYARQLLIKAVKDYRHTLSTYPDLAPMFERFVAADAILGEEFSDVKDKDVPSPNPVLRTTVRADGEEVVVPATRAMALVLRHRLSYAPRDMAALKEVCRGSLVSA